MTLSEKQRLFARLVGLLISKIYGLGYECTLGEVWRAPATAAANAAAGIGIANSLHIDKLAIDINLFKDGVFVSTSEAHAPFGEFWKTLHPACRWGGDFAHKPDGNHYSLTPDGVRA